ncbi:hypothetical protein VKS41_001675 [Umbelopsis sp. WA50703]
MLMSSKTHRSRDEGTARKTNRILEIGKPIEFEHGIHVEFNREKGKFMGLPDVWQGVIPSSDDVLDTSCISPHLVPAPYIIAHSSKADNISKPYNVQHNIHVQIDKASYVLQGLPPAWAHQLQGSCQAPDVADFQNHHTGTRARSSMNPYRSTPISQPPSPLPKSKSFTEIRRKASKSYMKNENSNETQNPLLLYKDIIEIAEGESGSLYSATLISAPRTMVAIKRIDLSKVDAVERKKTEMEAMKQCRHPNTINYIAHHITSTELWIVMEYLDTCLADIITNDDPELCQLPLSERQIAYILKQILLALEHIHSCGRMHRDIRADNILLNADGLIKLADFGHSAQLTSSAPKRTSVVGTPFWMAPEVIKGEEYDTSADIWSLGALLYELLTGSPPYSEYPPLRALFLIASKGLPECPKDWSEDLNNFMEQCTQIDPRSRPSAQSLLQHPFIAKMAGTSECVQELFTPPCTHSSTTTEEADTATITTESSTSMWSWLDEPNALNMDFHLAFDFDNINMSSTLET